MGLLPSVVALVGALTAAAAYYYLLSWLASASDVQDFTAAQIGISIGYGIVVSIWIGAEAGFFIFSRQPRYDSVNGDTDEEGSTLVHDSKDQTGGETSSRGEPQIFFVKRMYLPALRVCGEFVFIMGYIYFCDRTSFVAKGPKELSPTRFWALNAVILAIGLCTLRSTGNDGVPVKPLQRDQTEEWKGWMQIMFVLYHYFAEAEIYNAIRLYIAAYVWMTGFGNFSYYYIKQDFTVVRFAQMMWRLNFFVFFICVTMNNEYMLYYICAMHTFFTWLVYLALYAFNSLNHDNKVCFLKILLTAGFAVVLYDVPGVFHTVFHPLKFLLDFHDPLHPEFNSDPLHEWFFRSGLDHLVWVFGMLCAFFFPVADAKLQAIEELPHSKRFLTKSVLLVATILAGVVYVIKIFSLGKNSYNKWHPFTSFIPIFLYMVLRNISPVLRRYHMEMFAWTGKITLETYILQFHVWMRTTGVNGSPKHLMVWIPGWYWTNFLLTSTVYIFISYRVFKITATLRDVCIPKDNRAIATRGAAGVAALAALYGLGSALRG